MKSIFKFISYKAKIVLFAMICLSIIMAIFASKLSIDASSQSLLKQSDPDLLAYNKMQNDYVLGEYLVIAFRPKDDLFLEKNLDTIRQITQEILKLNEVKSTTSILNVPLLQSVNGGLSELIRHTPTLSDNSIDINKAKQELANSPIYTNNIISKDLKTTAIVINLKNGLNKNQEAKLISNLRQIIAQYKGMEEIYLGGTSMIASDMIDFIKQDLSTYSILLAILIAICLWLFFKSIRWVILPLFICILSVIFASGIFEIMGWQITAVSSNFIAIQLIITTSIVIHLICTYKELALKNKKLDQRQLSYLTMSKKAKPSFWAIFTTIIGFASLCVSDIKPVMMLGVMMSVSVCISLILSFILFGSTLALLPPQKIQGSDKTKKVMQVISKIPLKASTKIFVIYLAIFALGLWGITKLKAENSFISYFDKKTEISKGMLLIDKDLGGTIPLDVVVKFNKNTKDKELDEFEMEFEQINDDSYYFDAKRVRLAEKIHKYLQGLNHVGSTLSINTLLQILNELKIGNDAFMLAAIQMHMPADFKDILINPYVNMQKDELRFSIRLKDSDEDLKRDELIKNIKNGLEQISKEENVKIEVLGAMVLYNNVLQSLVASQIQSIGITILILFLIFILIFRSATISFIAIISNLIPLCLVFGIMGILNIPLDVMSITIAAIAYGIGVDDIIHYIHRYLQERKTKKEKQAILDTHKSIGSAMLYTSAAIFVGFSTMMSSNFAPTIYFGGLICLVMMAMLVAALTLLPALLYKFKV